MHRILFALLTSSMIAAPSAAQQANLVHEFTEVAQSPPYLNCSARLTTDYQGSVLMRGRITIRDASAALKANEGSDDWSVPSISVEAAYGTQDADPAGTWNCYFEGEVIFDYSERVTITGTQRADVCPGERGAIRAEYIAKPELNWVPNCSQIQQYPGDPFVHSTDTHGTWGYVNGLLYNKLALIQEYSLWWYPENVRVTSGYRCPHRNALTQGAVPLSRHQYGDAMDMTPPLTYYSPPNEQEYNRLRSSAEQTNPSWMTTWSTYPGDRHLHADWR